MNETAKTEVPASATKEVEALVERFARNIEAYRRSSYLEEQVRIEFINPFFDALGWDIANRQGFAEQYKEVIHEDAIKVSGLTKAPDYSFRIGGLRKFFLEAKKPSILLKDEPSPAYQLRRYAWSAKLPLSILTDFEELAVYDCRIGPPRPDDKASVARVKYLDYMKYSEELTWIYGTFSKDAILKGSFDKYVESAKGKRGTSEVDSAFLKEIETWRDILAKNIALRNKKLSVNDLNFAVQKTIDRIIFLRMAEDRGIEPYQQLMAITNAARIYKRLTEIFYRTEDKYNSGLFDFKADRLTDTLKIDDKILKDIIIGLYYPKCPYEFSVLGADILGNIYEQFLGKVIRLTKGHQAKVEEKPEVKKAGGVYYTPKYIVDYIVQNTVGKIIGDVSDVGAGLALPKKGAASSAPTKGLTPKQISNIKILDPACGSGSFLLGAYQYLLDYHLKWYSEHDPQKRTKEIYKGPRGQWLLTTKEKKRILLNNIFGVDIDHQAVEVTKLSLLLKVLENENQDTLEKQLKLFKERALPDLGNNIKCGNSLIGPEFFHGKQMDFFDEDEKRRINTFDWEAELPDVFHRKGAKDAKKKKEKQGFDVVIGNPPYVRQETLGFMKEYFERNFKTYHGMADLYTYFIERAMSLLKPGGYFSYIVSNKWMRANYGAPLRKWMKKQEIIQIVDFGDLPVFKRATTYPCIIVMSKGKKAQNIQACKVKTLEFRDLAEYFKENSYYININSLDAGSWTMADPSSQNLLEKIKSKGMPLSEYVGDNIYYGIKTGLNKAFVIDKATRDRLIKEDKNSAEIIKPFLIGRDVKRYKEPKSSRCFIFTRHGIDIEKYPSIEKYLLQFKERLMPKPKNWKGENWKGRKPGNYKWYEIQDTIDYYQEFEKPKIIFPCIEKIASYVFDNKGFYSNDKTTIISLSDLFLIGLLNSKLLDYYFKNISSTKQGGYFEYKPMYVSNLPIIKLEPGNKKHDKIVELVEMMLDLHKRVDKSKNPYDNERIQRDIKATDREIDRLVYELYGLTEKEAKIIEHSF